MISMIIDWRNLFVMIVSCLEKYTYSSSEKNILKMRGAQNNITNCSHCVVSCDENTTKCPDCVLFEEKEQEENHVWVCRNMLGICNNLYLFVFNKDCLESCTIYFLFILLCMHGMVRLLNTLVNQTNVPYF